MMYITSHTILQTVPAMHLLPKNMTANYESGSLWVIKHAVSSHPAGHFIISALC